MTLVQETPVSTELTVRPVAGHIGAEVTGIDLRKPVAGNDAEKLRRKLHKYKVLFFRDQHIDHTQPIAFSRHFGTVTPSHPYDDEAPEGFPEILAVDSLEYERRFGRKKYSDDNK